MGRRRSPGHRVGEAVGDGALNTDTGARIPLSVKKGDRIIFSSYAGTEVKLNGETIATSDDLAVPEGHIGLQAEGGVLEFQRIDVKPLTK